MYIVDVACGHLLVSVGIKHPETSDMENHCNKPLWEFLIHSLIQQFNSFFNSIMFVVLL